MNDNKYVNGIYMTKIKGQYGDGFVLEFTEEGMTNLSDLEKDEKGKRRIVCWPRRGNNKLYNVERSKPRSSSRSQENDTPPPPSEDPITSDDLPF